jgi:SLAP domain-containing protein
MNSNLDIKLSLISDESISQLKKTVYEEELKDLNLKFPLNKNEFDIKQTYYIKKDNNLEVGFFIRNGLYKNIVFEDIFLVVQNEDGKDILSKGFDFKEYGIIPPYSARHFVVNFELNEDMNFNDNGKYTINFGNINNYKVFNSLLTELENMPVDLPFEEEQAIRDFFNKLDTMEEDEFSISVYSLSNKENGDIICMLLIRNGSSKTVNIKKLPVSIVSEDDITVAYKEFDGKEDEFKIDPAKSKLINLEFKFYEIYLNEYDISKCRVVFK